MHVSTSTARLPGQRRASAPARESRGGASRIAVLDALRLCAALMVVAYHYVALGRWGQPNAQVFPELFRPASYGWLGVQLFFLISGFVICMSGWGRSVSEFFTSRVIRLFPAYWLAVVATAAALVYFGGGYDLARLQQDLVNLTMLHRAVGVDDVDGVYWTLWAELRFYILFGLVIWRGVTYRRAVAFCFLWMVAAGISTTYPSGPVKLMLDPENCWYFIAGIAFYLIHRFGQNIVLWGIVAVCYLISERTVMGTFKMAEGHTHAHVPGYGAVVLLTVFYLVMAAVALGWFDRLRWRWLTTAGLLTYPLYLLHDNIGLLTIRHTAGRVSPGLLLAILVPAMLLLAYLVNRLVERPMSGWLKRRMRTAFDQIRNEFPGAGEREPAR